MFPPTPKIIRNSHHFRTLNVLSEAVPSQDNEGLVMLPSTESADCTNRHTWPRPNCLIYLWRVGFTKEKSFLQQKLNKLDPNLTNRWLYEGVPFPNRAIPIPTEGAGKAKSCRWLSRAAGGGLTVFQLICIKGAGAASTRYACNAALERCGQYATPKLMPEDQKRQQRDGEKQRQRHPSQSQGPSE